MYVLLLLPNELYTFGTGIFVLAAIYCIAAASDRCSNGPYLTHMLDVRRTTDDSRGRSLQDRDSCQSEVYSWPFVLDWWLARSHGMFGRHCSTLLLMLKNRELELPELAESNTSQEQGSHETT